jgi:hypothetical protein
MVVFLILAKIMPIKNKIVIMINEDKIVEKSNCNKILQKL